MDKAIVMSVPLLPDGEYKFDEQVFPDLELSCARAEGAGDAFSGLDPGESILIVKGRHLVKVTRMK